MIASVFTKTAVLFIHNLHCCTYYNDMKITELKQSHFLKTK